MSQRSVREFHGKQIIAHHLIAAGFAPLLHAQQSVLVTPDTDLSSLGQHYPWLLTTPLVVKPDQLIKRRGKHGLVGVNLTLPQVIEWITARAGTVFQASAATSGVLDTFIIEPFVAHATAEKNEQGVVITDEYYLCIQSSRHCDEILFYHDGGVDIGQVDEKVSTIQLPLSLTTSTTTTSHPQIISSQEEHFDIFAHATKQLAVCIDDEPRLVTVSPQYIESKLLQHVPAYRRQTIAVFISALYLVYQFCHFAYLEINPLVWVDAPAPATDSNNNSTSHHYPGRLVVLDLAAKIDEAAAYLCDRSRWTVRPTTKSAVPIPLIFPQSFGCVETPEERAIHQLDGTTGASLKLTVLNPKGRIWLLVAGGGASVVYADTVADLGFGHELANYGEYSGAPTTAQTYQYASTLFSLMVRDSPDELLDSSTTIPLPKVLLIGGGVANFTDIASTFKGIIQALDQYADALRRHNVHIFVRRAGPNYQEGLRLMKLAGARLELPITVYGPEMHMTGIIPLALHILQEAGAVTRDMTAPGASSSLRSDHNNNNNNNNNNTSFEGSDPYTSHDIDEKEDTQTTVPSTNKLQLWSNVPEMRQKIGSIAQTLPYSESSSSFPISEALERTLSSPFCSFSSNTRCIVYGLQRVVVQQMLDYDLLTGRKTPSVAALVYPVQGTHGEKFFWGAQEICLPCYQLPEDALRAHPDVSCIVNYASFRRAYDVTTNFMNETNSKQIKFIAIVAEGVPERCARAMIAMSIHSGVQILGAASVGGICCGQFRFGAAGGTVDNILASRLQFPGPVACVTRSGGLSNELSNILSRSTGGAAATIAIGGDKYPITTFASQLLAYQADPNVAMMVLLGELGGEEEYQVVELLNQGKLTKPLVALCIGTVSELFPYEVQFGHAGACAHGKDAAQATTKNLALARAGAFVPTSFQALPAVLHTIYNTLVSLGQVPSRDVMLKRCQNALEAISPSSSSSSSSAPLLMNNGPIPTDYSWASRLGLIRKSTNIMSSISDERGAELFYAGVSVLDIVTPTISALSESLTHSIDSLVTSQQHDDDESLPSELVSHVARIESHQQAMAASPAPSSVSLPASPIGTTLGLLWFKKQLPLALSWFLELVLVLTADHGPAVSGAHNTIVTARAGKDLISSLCSGLLTIGPRFGGALDQAGCAFFQASRIASQHPVDFVTTTPRISGIGHRHYNIMHPDTRVLLLLRFLRMLSASSTKSTAATQPSGIDSKTNSTNEPDMSFLAHFPTLHFALQVEAITSKKRNNLILNVDGAIAAAFIDFMLMPRSWFHDLEADGDNNTSLFSVAEVKQYLDLGMFNALFVLGRSIGLIGHYIDQNRMQQPLYRHPTEDILYLKPEENW